MNENEVPELIENYNNPMNGNDSDDEEFDGEEELMDFCQDPCKDLFSDEVFKTPSECLKHCKSQYDFDLLKLSQAHGLDFYSFIRLINYIRKAKPSPESIMSCQSAIWEDDKYLVPAIENDPMLMIDFDEFISNCNDTSSNNEMDQLQKKFQEQAKKIEELQEALGDLENMRHLTKKLVIDADDDDEKLKNKSVSSMIKENEDGGYAGSYAHFSIHHEMLSDFVRTNAYQKAIYDNADQIKDKTVLDLGCGTGILSMFCAQAGAKEVIAVDMSDIIHHTMDIIRENGFQNQIKLIKGRLEDIEELRGKRFDIIVSEWMGYFLLYEGMLDSVLTARDQYLAPGGLILPNICNISIFAICDLERYGKTIDYWKNVYGFKMSCMKEPVLTEASIEIVPKDKIASEIHEILNLNLDKCKIQDFADFKTNFELQMVQDGPVTAIGGCFDTIFGLNNPVTLPTDPKNDPTHWKQTIFYLEDPISVQKGQTLQGHIHVYRPPKDARSLMVKLKIGNQVRTYDMA